MRKSIFTLLLSLIIIHLLLGCRETNDDDDASSFNTNTGLIGTEGGTITTASGAVIVIPPGALAEETSISVNSHYSMASLPAPSPFAGGARFGPDGLVFNSPVTITVPLASAQGPGTELALFAYDEQRGGWLLTEFTVVVNPDGLSASGEVTHFTDYIIMGKEYNDLYFRLFREVFFDICTLTPISELFENYIDWFTAHCFTIGRKDPWDFSAHYADRGYSCYQTTGIDYVLRATRSIPDPTDPNGEWTEIEGDVYERETGVKGTVAMVFIDDDDKIISSSSCGEYQLTYSWDVTVHLECALPELKMEVGRSQLNVGEQTDITGCLSCGADKMKDQDVYFSVNSLGSIRPTQKATNDNGDATIKFTAGNEEGTATVTAMYEACTGQEQQESVDAEVNILIEEPTIENWSFQMVYNWDLEVTTSRTIINGAFTVDFSTETEWGYHNFTGRAFGETTCTIEPHDSTAGGFSPPCSCYYSCPGASKTQSASYSVHGEVWSDRDKFSIWLTKTSDDEYLVEEYYQCECSPCEWWSEGCETCEAEYLFQLLKDNDYGLLLFKEGVQVEIDKEEPYYFFISWELNRN